MRNPSWWITTTGSLNYFSLRFSIEKNTETKQQCRNSKSSGLLGLYLDEVFRFLPRKCLARPFILQPICSDSDHHFQREDGRGRQKSSGFAKWSRNYGISLFAWISSAKLRRGRSRHAAIRQEKVLASSLLCLSLFVGSASVRWQLI